MMMWSPVALETWSRPEGSRPSPMLVQSTIPLPPQRLNSRTSRTATSTSPSNMLSSLGETQERSRLRFRRETGSL